MATFGTSNSGNKSVGIFPSSNMIKYISLSEENGDIITAREETIQYAMSFASVASNFPDSSVTVSSVSSSLVQMAIINNTSTAHLSASGANLSDFSTTDLATAYDSLAKTWFEDSEKDANGHILCCGSPVASATAANIIYFGFPKKMILDGIYYSGLSISLTGGGGSLTAIGGTYTSSTSVNSNVVDIINSASGTKVGKMILDSGIGIIYGYDNTVDDIVKVIVGSATDKSTHTSKLNTATALSAIRMSDFALNAVQKKYQNIYYCELPFNHFNQSTNPTWRENQDIINYPRTFVCYIGLYGERMVDGVPHYELYAVAGLGAPVKKNDVSRPSFLVNIKL